MGGPTLFAHLSVGGRWVVSSFIVLVLFERTVIMTGVGSLAWKDSDGAASPRRCLLTVGSALQVLCLCHSNFLFPHFSERIIWKIQSVPKNPRENAKEYKNGKFTLP